MEDVENVESLKRHLHTHYDFPVLMQQLVKDECILDDDAPLDAASDLQLFLLLHTSCVWYRCFSSKRHVEVAHVLLKSLLEAGFRMDLQDGWGYTALMDACIGGHVASASVLPEAGANKDLTDILGNTALISACDRICLPGDRAVAGGSQG